MTPKPARPAHLEESERLLDAATKLTRAAFDAPPVEDLPAIVAALAGAQHKISETLRFIDADLVTCDLAFECALLTTPDETGAGRDDRAERIVKLLTLAGQALETAATLGTALAADIATAEQRLPRQDTTDT